MTKRYYADINLEIDIDSYESLGKFLDGLHTALNTLPPVPGTKVNKLRMSGLWERDVDVAEEAEKLDTATKEKAEV